MVLNYVRGDYQFQIGGENITCRNVSSGFSVPWGFMGLEYSGRGDIELLLDYDAGLLDDAHGKKCHRAPTRIAWRRSGAAGQDPRRSGT